MKLRLNKWRWTTTKIGVAINREEKQTGKKGVRLGLAARSAPFLLFVFFPAFLFALAPAAVSANIEITEIMYDAPGADTGREWVEVTNTGSESIDIGKFKLLENGTNHGLKIISGNSFLSPTGSAIFASDAEKFKADYPAYSGTLFDTAFSLSNTGETLVLINVYSASGGASSTVLDTASYEATEDTNGTGGSLQKSGGAFVAALASPGIYPGTFTPVPKVEKPTPAPKTTKKASTASTSTKKSAATTATSKPVPTASVASAGNFLPSIPTNILWYAALAGIILVGIAGVLFLQFNKKETSITADEFKIE